jgi:23S rRNA G2445 N2-methylase RlmL
MKNADANPDKELYRQLRNLSCEELWDREVPSFDRATPEERIKQVAVVRAVGVIFSESGTAKQKDAVRPWLRRLLNDPSEKIRRYAMTALPKIGAGAVEETELLSLLRKTQIDREKRFLGQTLEKIGGAATLQEVAALAGGPLLRTEQKVKASLARSESPSTIRLDRAISNLAGLRIHLRGRRGLESLVKDELEEHLKKNGKFRIIEVLPGLVAIAPLAPFAISDLLKLRCFDTLGFALAPVRASGPAQTTEALASAIASPLSRRILETFTEGSVRYRLDFVSKGHQRGAVHDLASRVYAMCPEILNDARSAPWTIAIYPGERGDSVELCPKLSPDPRYYYRQGFVSAASHPPLAACMARLSGTEKNEIAWDPFCGSGVELIERALLGGVRSVHGTDRNANAVAIAEGNFAAANLKSVQAKFTCADFRDFARVEGLGPNTVTLIITNPPLGKRVPIPNLDGLIQDLLRAASIALKPGGRLVLVNPVKLEYPHPLLKLQYRQIVDLGGFDCYLEKYVKLK